MEQINKEATIRGYFKYTAGKGVKAMATKGQYKQIAELMDIQLSSDLDLYFIVEDEKRLNLYRAEATNLILLLRKLCGQPISQEPDMSIIKEIGGFAG